MVTVLEFKEVMGNCVNAGKVTVEHNFENIDKLIQYLKDNWFDLENADKIDSIEIDLDIEGDFLLTINSLIIGIVKYAPKTIQKYHPHSKG